MEKLFKILIALSLAFLGVSCSSGEDSKPVEFETQNLSGLYRTMGTLSEIPSVTALEVLNGRSETELEIEILRNGLSYEEYAYFNTLNAVQWADDHFGRELSLAEFKTGLQIKNRYENETSYVDVCGEKLALDRLSRDFRYCVSMTRKEGSLIAEGDLILEAYEFGNLIHEIKSPFKVFIKDRWFVDYFGYWAGPVVKSNSQLQISQIEVTFQPISENHFILRPYDVHHTINLGSERFILQPENRLMSDLEKNAHPYVNFTYVSEQDGARKIHFKTHIREEGYMEGTVLLEDSSGRLYNLAVYSLSQM